MANILIVDDNLDLQNILKLMLNRLGYDVTTADNGQRGLELAFSQPFDLILLDVMMPDLDGYEVSRRLRADARTQNLPIIIVTARSQPVDERSAINAGADAYFPKPVDMERLTDKIAELLATGRPKPVERDAQAGGRLICVLGWRGGAGATTLAVNVAGGLLRARRRICLFDLCPGAGHAAIMLRLRPQPSWADLPSDMTPQTMGAVLLKHESGLYVLASPAQPQPQNLPAQTFNKVIQALFNVFTEIVVDCSPVLDATTRAALLLASSVLLPITPDITSIHTLTGALGALASLNLPAERWRIVLNHPSPNSGLLPARIESALGRQLDAVLPYDQAQISAVLQGAPLIFSQPHSPYVSALGALLQKL